MDVVVSGARSARAAGLWATNKEPVHVKILIVDDSMAMRRIVARTLRQAGYGGHEIVEAPDGLKALEVVKASSPDVILCDWNMPEMSGLEFLQKLRADGVGTTFGFITTEGSEEMRQIAQTSGAAFLLAKPFTAEDMQSVLSGVLK